MQFKDMKELIGKTGALSQTDGLIVHVSIKDIKQAYGQIRYSVSPVAGDGEVWVSAERVAVLSNTLFGADGTEVVWFAELTETMVESVYAVDHEELFLDLNKAVENDCMSWGLK